MFTLTLTFLFLVLLIMFYRLQLSYSKDLEEHYAKGGDSDYTLDTLSSLKGLFMWLKYISAIALIILLGTSVIVTVPAGHVKVATLFGKINSDEYQPGFHIVNPLYSFHSFDARQQTHKETATVPSQDQLTTSLDVSVQYRLIASQADSVLANTGNLRNAIDVHLIPKLRSILREQGKSVERAEDFFKESTQVALQGQLLTGLDAYLKPRGVLVSEVLIRDIRLPAFITAAIKAKKEREQAAERQIAELARFATEQEQKVKTAMSERDAAVLDAEKIRLLADAESYKIKLVNEQLSKSPEYVRLKSVEQWDGVLPKYSGGENIPMIDLRNK